MIETLVFLLGQLLINVLVKEVKNDRLSYIFTSLSYLIFGILLLLYPYWSYRINDLMNPPDPSSHYRCGNAQIGSVMFQYIVGGSLGLLAQYLLNKHFHKDIRLLKQGIEAEARHPKE